MSKHLFTVIAARPLIADAWLTGALNDFTLIQENGCGRVPCPAVLVILRVDGNAAGMRRLFAWLCEFAREREIAGFAMRTRLAGVERVFARFGGRVTFDEGDGDRRWWAPAQPGLAWLTGRG